MNGRSLLSLLSALLAPLTAHAQQADTFIVVTEKHALDAGTSGDDGPGTIDGVHVMRFPAPPPGRLRSMRVGEQIIVKLHSVSGASNVGASPYYYDGRAKQRRKCPATYAADLRVDKSGGPGLFIRRTPAGFELATFPYSEYFVEPYQHCAEVPHGSCAFVLQTQIVFQVSTDDVEMLDAVRGTYSGKGDWNEGEARMCNATVTATLNGDLVPEDEVAVEGPSCACDGKPVTFTAKAKTGGGSFEKWDVKPSKDAPTVVENSGGSTAKLVLSGDAKRIGATTVTAVYRKHGKVFRSRPKDVHFCRVEKPKPQQSYSGSNRKDYRFASESDVPLNIPMEGQAWLDGEEADKQERWEVTPNPSGILRADPLAGKYTQIRGDTLPERNDEFGEKEIRARIVERGCDCSSEAAEVRLFFDRDRRNNPGGGKEPNWAYYWRQTSAGKDSQGRPTDFTWVEQVPPPIGFAGIVGTAARYEPYTDTIYLGGQTLTACCKRLDGRKSDGIDCFGEALRHESVHREELSAWWGYKLARYPCAKTPICSVDWDLDLVPNDFETAHGCDPKGMAPGGGENLMKYGMVTGKALPTCPGMPLWCGADAKNPTDPMLNGMSDLEMDAYTIGWSSWTIGSAKDEDWAVPGSQWPKGN